MSELARVAAALIESARSGETSVLATVVRTEGSTYRRIGARLVVLPDGVRTGTVSAGCVEQEILACVADVRAAGSPAVMTYDTRSPDDLVWGFGLGCGGMVDVMLEPLTPEQATAKAARLAFIASARQRTVLATVVRAPASLSIRAGDQAVLMDTTSSLDGLDCALRADFQRAARGAWRRGRSAVVQHTWEGESIDVVYEVIAPRVRLAVCGAGIDAVPVVAAAKQLGWHVTLIDDRPAMADAHRWPDADRIIVPRPTAIAESVAEADSEAAIIMSHNFERDVDFLQGWLDTTAGYIGVMGPHHRLHAMLAALSARDVRVDALARERIRGPVGLDLGAETPEEIALAIVAEVQAVHAGRTAGFLALRAGSIHASALRTLEGGEEIRSAYDRQAIGCL
jgi:xanthine dehydrogenase accessory factor